MFGRPWSGVPGQHDEIIALIPFVRPVRPRPRRVGWDASGWPPVQRHAPSAQRRRFAPADLPAGFGRWKAANLLSEARPGHPGTAPCSAGPAGNKDKIH